MREVTYYSGGLQRRDVPFWTIKISRSTSRILLCALYIAHGIIQRKGPERCVRKVWNGLRSISSKKSLLMMHVRKLVIAAVKEVGMEPVEIKWGYSGIHEGR